MKGDRESFFWVILVSCIWKQIQELRLKFRVSEVGFLTKKDTLNHNLSKDGCIISNFQYLAQLLKLVCHIGTLILYIVIVLKVQCHQYLKARKDRLAGHIHIVEN
jgi:hypothetical protein